MKRDFQRQTLGESLRFEGVGLHSGQPVVVQIHPGLSGYQWQAQDGILDLSPLVVTQTVRCTEIQGLATIEHVLSALAGMGITDAVLEVTGSEMPALDGSALPFAKSIAAASKVNCGRIVVNGPFARVYEKEEDLTIAVGKGEGHWKYVFHSDERWPHEQAFETWLTPDSFLSEIAGARTFCFEEEVEPLRTAGLGKGLDESSVLVLGKEGYVNKARFDDEPARHKLMDLIGDLALCGIPPQALNVSAHRSGHRSNNAMARRLMEHVQIERINVG